VPPLFESLTRLASRMELFAVGAESDRRLAETSLREGRPLDAREHALRLLDRAPDSPVGLALLADAAEELWLDEEAAAALLALTKTFPWRADVWLRLGRATKASEPALSRSAFERAADAVDDPASRRAAAFELCDRDLDAGEPARALAWLERVATRLDARDEALLVRRAECLFALGQVEAAAKLVESLPHRVGEETRDAEEERDRLVGRRALLFGRLLFALTDLGDPLKRRRALEQILRAYVLEVPGAQPLLGALVASTRDAAELRDLVGIVSAAGDQAAFAVSIALAEGREEDVRAELIQGARKGDQAARAALFDLAKKRLDRDALAVFVETATGGDDGGSVRRLSAAKTLLAATARAGEGDVVGAVDLLTEVTTFAELSAWARTLMEDAFRLWTDAPRPSFDEVHAFLLDEAAAGADREANRALEHGRFDDSRPITVAVLGEFNAGKSTFINAFVGADVAPTGILPTTATVHRVAFAPDAFARVLVRGAPDRILTHDRLRETLGKLADDGALVLGVQIYAPIERLKWTEILDTPGFNSSNEEHDASARRALREAHAVLWLADATSPIKASEAEILKEVHEEGLPVLLLVNKRDRVRPASVPEVMRHVEEAARTLGPELLAAPLLFSAKQALAGRLGDAELLAASGWPEVEATIALRLVDTASELRESAHRRRTARLVEGMAAHRARLEDAAATEHASTLDRARQLRAVATECEVDRGAVLLAMMNDLEPSWRTLTDDLVPLRSLRGDASSDAAVRSYVAERLERWVAEPGTEWLARRFTAGEVPAALPLARASLSGVALGSTALPLGTSREDKERLLSCVLRAFATGCELLGRELLAKGDPVRRSERLRALGRALLRRKELTRADQMESKPEPAPEHRAEHE
jgi:cellulose synthase operon protein C